MKRCEKYSEWMSDAAAGALAPGREAKLLAHAAECADCRAAYEHARELAAAVNRGVESLVSGEPSPHFATRLRARIAEEGQPAGFAWLGWKPIAAGLMALVAAIVFVSYTPHQPHPQPTRAHARPEAIPNSTTAAQPEPSASTSATTAESVQSSASLNAGRHENSRSGLSSAVPAKSQPAAHQHQVAQHVAPQEAEVIVPPGQLAAVMQFVDAVKSGRIDGKQLLANEEQADKPLEIAPIKIAPLEIKPLDAESTSVSAEPANSNHP